VTLSKPIKYVEMTTYFYTMGETGIESTTGKAGAWCGENGETISADNPLITDAVWAIDVGRWMGTHLGHRITLDSSWRADVRLDALDIVTNENGYNSKQVRMTEVEFRFNGAFRGTGEGKVI
jgi:hypothetical protein